MNSTYTHDWLCKTEIHGGEIWGLGDCDKLTQRGIGSWWLEFAMSQPGPGPHAPFLSFVAWVSNHKTILVNRALKQKKLQNFKKWLRNVFHAHFQNLTNKQTNKQTPCTKTEERVKYTEILVNSSVRCEWPSLNLDDTGVEKQNSWPLAKPLPVLIKSNL